jgi:transposase-like protein
MEELILEFTPPRCPNRVCPAHRAPPPGFFRRAGSYQPQCRDTPVPRFVCLVCRRGFSRQTFRLDYRDKKPHHNRPLFSLLTSGVGLRQAARVLDLGVGATQRKFRKIARHMRLLNRNLLPRWPGDRTFLLDEMESFEHRVINPLTIPVLIERGSKFVLAVDVAPIRRMAQRGSWRRRWLERHEAEVGRRQDRGRDSVRRVFGRFARLLDDRPATLITDEKALYGAMCRRRFGEQVEHHTVPSRLPRTTYNPLFAINLTDAMLRDNNGRLRRRSWLVSKRGRFLRLQLELFAVYRNWHRKRHNDDDDDFTPAVASRLFTRRLRLPELLAWRQDWRRRSIHPASDSGLQTVADQVA